MHPVLFTIGGIEFYSYGLMIGIGYVLGVLVAVKRAEAKGIDPDSLLGFFVLILVSGVTGGRLFHIALNTWNYPDLKSVFRLQDGGLSIHGVLFGGLLDVYKRQGYDGGQWLPLPECTELMTAGKDVNVILQDQSYRVGIRLTRLGIANPFTPGGRTESAFEKELTRKIRVDVDSMDSGSGLDGTGLPGYTEDQGPNADFPEDPTGDGEGIPGVRVVYRNKHTTLWKPEEVCHLYWEVDFGDGESCLLYTSRCV